jgi:hypothetical protein
MQQQQSTFAKLLLYILLYKWLIRVIRKVTLYSPCLWASFHLLSPHFQWYPQSHEILLNLSMKCWISAFNAQRLIIIGALKIYVAAVEVLRQKERQDETQFTTKFDGFLWPNSGLWWCFAYFMDNSINIIRTRIYMFLVYFMWNPPFLQANLCLNQRWHLSCKVRQIPYTKGASSPLKIIIAGLFIEAKFYHFFTMSKKLEQGCSGNSCLALSFQTDPSLQGPTPGTYGKMINHGCQSYLCFQGIHFLHLIVELIHGVWRSFKAHSKH